MLGPPFGPNSWNGTSLESGAQVQLEIARVQLIRRFSERTLGHIPIHADKIGAVEQVKHLASGLQFQPFSKEPWSGEAFAKGEVDVVISFIVVGVATEVAFHS